MNTDYREKIKNKKRIVVKVGTSSLIHKETGAWILSRWSIWCGSCQICITGVRM